jgi:CheY-like chemotaxis protein
MPVNPGRTLPPPASIPPSGARAPHLRTVLVADGNSTTASLTRTLARVALGRSASYVSVSSCSEAVVASHLHPPDLVISEFRLHGSDGVETLRQIRKGLGTDVPAVFTVQKIEHEYVKRRLPDRSAIVVRPFDRNTFEAALRSLFEPQGRASAAPAAMEAAGEPKR